MNSDAFFKVLCPQAQSGTADTQGSINITTVDPETGSQVNLSESDESHVAIDVTGTGHSTGGIAAGVDLPTSASLHLHGTLTLSGNQHVIQISSGSLSGGTSTGGTSTLDVTYSGTVDVDAMCVIGAGGVITETDTLSGHLQGTITGSSSNNDSVFRTSGNTNGNSASIDETMDQSGQVQGTFDVLESAQEVIVTNGDQLVSDTVTDSRIVHASIVTTIDETSSGTDVSTSVDDQTGLATTTTDEDLGGTAHTVITDVTDLTYTYSDSLSGIPTHTVTGGTTTDVQATNQIRHSQVNSWEGTDDQGVTHHNQQVIAQQITMTGHLTGVKSFLADGSSTDSSTGVQTANATQTKTMTGTLSSTDSTTGVVSTTQLNETFTISGLNASNVVTEQTIGTDGNVSGTPTKTNSGAADQTWTINDTTVQVNSSGVTVGTTTNASSGQNTIHLENGQAATQGTAAPEANNGGVPQGGNGGGGGGQSGSGGGLSQAEQDVLNILKSDVNKLSPGAGWNFNGFAVLDGIGIVAVFENSALGMSQYINATTGNVALYQYGEGATSVNQLDGKIIPIITKEQKLRDFLDEINQRHSNMQNMCTPVSIATNVVYINRLVPRNTRPNAGGGGNIFIDTGNRDRGAGTSPAKKFANTKEFQFADRVGFEDISEYRSLKADIARNGFKNNIIEYVEISGQKYVVRGNQRLQIAEDLGKADQLSFKKVELPFLGYLNEADVIEEAINIIHNRPRGTP